MSFLRKLAGATPPADEEIPRAVLTPSVSAIMADGDMQSPEVRMLSNICAFSPIFHHIEPERLAEIVRELIAEVMDRGGATMLAEAAAKLDHGLRETAFCFVVRLIMADGKIGEHEKEALKKIEEVLGLDSGEVAQIYTVIAMMQRPAH
ncbi:MAG: tellurite resistance TerB family protein [Pseudomonadota bacterium]